MDLQLEGSNVIITGGAGFVGSHLAKRLYEEGAKVVVIDSFIPEYGGNLFNLRDVSNIVHVNYSDIRDKYSLSHLIRDKDFLFNLAGQTSHLDSMHNPFTDLDINCIAQLSILEVCRFINPKIKIIYASTRQIYGRPQYLPVNEEHPIVPVDVNGINKYSSEMYHQLYNNVYGISTCCLRMTNTIGPHMRIKDDRQTFVGTWIKRLLEGDNFEVWGGKQIRDFTYVDDCVEAFIRAAKEKRCYGHSFNLGGPKISLLRLAELMIKINGSGKHILKEFPEERGKIDIGDYYSDDSLFRSVTGWEPKYNLTEMLTKTIEFYKAHLKHYL